MRGIAAATVVLHHLFLTFPATQPDSDSLIGRLTHTPLHILWSGTEAVNLFFVLSGFVLALPFLKAPQPYGRYALKRIARIWTPYIVVAITALVLRALLDNEPVPSLSKWFNDVWVGSISTYDLVGHFLLIPPFDNDQLVPVFWSLVHEMRISLLFSLVMLLVTRAKMPVIVVTAVAMSLIGLALALVAAKRPILPMDIALSVMFLPLFIMGATMAKHRAQIVQWLQALPKSGRWGLLALGVALYTFPHWAAFLPKAVFLATRVPMSAFGSALFIAIALASGRASGLLTSKPLLVLGHVSYSLYLVHALVIVATLRAVGPAIGYAAAAVIAVAVMIPATWLCYQFVEKPAIRLSRSIGRARKSA